MASILSKYKVYFRLHEPLLFSWHLLLSFVSWLFLVYHKQGKIRWAKLSWIPPNVGFHGKTFVMPYVYNTKTTPLYEACII